MAGTTTNTGKSSTDTDDRAAEHLNSVLTEAEEYVETESHMTVDEIAREVADNNRHLTTHRASGARPTDLEVLAELRERGYLSVDNLEMHKQAATSYDEAEATVEALVTASLERFIYDHLEAM
jgi:hypothetical protein